jgi:hypothetical protein
LGFADNTGGLGVTSEVHVDVEQIADALGIDLNNMTPEELAALEAVIAYILMHEHTYARIRAR